MSKGGGGGGGAKNSGGVGGRSGKGPAAPAPTVAAKPSLAERKAARRAAELAARPKPDAGLATKALSAVKDLGGPNGSRVTLADLKSKLGNPDQAKFQATMLKLQDQGHVVLYRNDVTRKLQPRDLDAQIKIGGGVPRDIVYLA